MNKKLKSVFTLILLLSSVSLAQSARLQSMGGLKFIIQDTDNSLSLYDFGRNMSWLINDEKQSMLKINPSYDRTWGDYKRKYDFGSADLYTLSFTGIKPLDESGTFLGNTSYSYNSRNDVCRTLRYNPYAGDAFFPEDSSTGNYRYNGPKVGFGYSYELFSGLYIGGAVNYQILEGLKSIYSNTLTTIRNFEGQGALSYKLTNNLAAGLTYSFFDYQEAMEMSSLTGTNVEVFNYRGETYAVTAKGSKTIPQKIRTKGYSTGLQLHYAVSDDLELALAGSYGTSRYKYLVTSSALRESEEGFASFENYNVSAASSYKASENLKLGLQLESRSTNSWSRNSIIDLMLWKWKVNLFSASAGAQYYIEPADLLIGVEYESGFISCDSSKFIDNRFSDINSVNHLIRAGAEKEIINGFFLRAGCTLGSMQYDLAYGGKDVSVNAFSGGAGIQVSDLIFIDLTLQYGGLAPQNSGPIYRDKFNIQAAVRVLNF